MISTQIIGSGLPCPPWRKDGETVHLENVHSGVRVRVRVYAIVDGHHAVYGRVNGDPMWQFFPVRHWRETSDSSKDASGKQGLKNSP